MANTVSIDGIQFEFVNIPSAIALKLATKVAKFVGPVLGSFQNVKDIGVDKEIDPGMLEKIGDVISNLDEDQLEYFRKEFAEYSVWIDNEGNSKPLRNIAYFEQCFQGNVVFMIKWMFEFARTNFFSGMNF